MTASLADQFRSLPDNTLAALLRSRPDLVVPVPSDLTGLAARAQSRTSVARAMDGLDEFTLRILDAARLTRDPATGLTSVTAVLNLATTGQGGVDRAVARAALDRLRALFLVHGPDSALSVVAAVDEVSGPYPAGLGRPAAQLGEKAAHLCADPARLRRTVLAAPAAARAILDRLAAGPPVGTVDPAVVGTATGGSAAGTAATASAVRWLIEHALLVPVAGGQSTTAGPTTVELPRELGLLLRRDTGPLGQLRPQPPTPTGTSRDPAAADSAGAGQAMEVVRHTEALLESLSAEPSPVLRSGGLGVRELRRLARVTGLDEETAALLLEVAYAAGLLGELDVPGTARAGGPDQQILPTAGYELWRGGSLAQRWVQLARTWLAMTRQPGLVGQRDDRDRAIAVLSPDVERTGMPATRRAVIDTLADLPPGTAPDADEVLALLTWRSPRRTRGRESVHRQVLAEAARLGLTGLDALTSYGRLLLADIAAEEGRLARADADPLGVRAASDEVGGEAAAALEALLPAPVDHFLVQADLTVVVPGPPEPDLAAELEAVAEPESAGGASVYRVTEASLRHGLDTGFAAEDLHRIFARRSRTPIPQTLTYLIDDVARRHGGLRVGAAGAYLRGEDEALLAEVLADRRLAGLGLRKLAPTVLVTPYQTGRVLAALREAGYAPVPEDATGAAMLTRPKVRRAPGRPALASRVADPLAAPALSPPRLLGIVEQLRRGEALARAARRAPSEVRAGNGHAGKVPPHAHTQALAVLQQALRDKALVWVGYVDAHGATASRLLRPVSIGAGYLRAEDERTEMLHTFALHRITAAVLDG